MRGYAIFLICIAFFAHMLFSCSKAHLSDGKNLKQDLQRIIDSELYINQIVRNDEDVKITLSNGRGYIYSGKSIVFYTIGLNGFWYRNGKCTSYLFNEPIEEKILSLVCSDAEEVTAICEGYEDWTFYSANHTPFVI